MIETPEIRQLFHDINSCQHTVSMGLECLEDVIEDEETLSILKSIIKNSDQVTELVASVRNKLNQD